jgi:MFS family permease
MLVNVLKSSETWLGPIQIAGTAATILSGFMIGFFVKRFKPTFLISAGLVVFGIAVAITGFANAPWQLMIFQFVIGWVVTPINVSIVTLNQTAVEDSLRGRAGSARTVIASAAQLLSMAFAGVFGDLIGVRQVFFIAAAFIVLSGFASALTFRVPASEKQV